MAYMVTAFIVVADPGAEADSREGGAEPAARGGAGGAVEGAHDVADPRRRHPRRVDAAV